MIGLTLVGALALACGGNNNNNNQDMATPQPDLTDPPKADMATPDLADPPKADMATPDLASAAKTVTVTVGANGARTFTPKDVTINVGDTVKWEWAGGSHNVVSGTVVNGAGVPDNKFCSPNNMNCANAATQGAGTTYSFKFTTAGTFPYYCKPHAGSMTGSVIVK